jgi:hypothetical protein
MLKQGEIINIAANLDGMSTKIMAVMVGTILLWLGHLDVCSLILKLSERIGFPVQRS